MFADFKEELPTSLYIGKTVNSLNTRYKQHLSKIKRALAGKDKWFPKYNWMYGIIKSGADLRIIRLMIVPKLFSYEYEKIWINYFRDLGFRVINKDDSKHINKKIVEI